MKGIIRQLILKEKDNQNYAAQSEGKSRNFDKIQ